MWKNAHWGPRVWRGTAGLFALMCLVGIPGVTLGADRVVLCEEFTNTG